MGNSSFPTADSFICNIQLCGQLDLRHFLFLAALSNKCAKFLCIHIEPPCLYNITRLKSVIKW